MTLLRSLLARLRPAAAPEPQTLRIAAMAASDAERRAWRALVDGFAAANPDIEAELLTVGEASYKAEVAGWLERGEYDVMTGLGGAALRRFAAAGLVAPLGAAWRERGFDDLFTPAARHAVSVDGEPFGLPLNQTAWMLVYRRSVLARLGLPAPRQWEELLRAMAMLRASGLVPIALAGREGWPAASWFDAIGLRRNGADFHGRLLAGEEPWDQPRVRGVLTELGRLRPFLDPAFREHGWHHVVAEIGSERAGFALLPSYVAAMFWDDVRGELGCCPVPHFGTGAEPERPAAELAPTDLLMVAARGPGGTAAGRFLAHAASAPVQARFNAPQGKISANRLTPMPEDPLAAAGTALLHRAPALVDFFDREIAPEAVGEAVEALLAFLSGGAMEPALAALSRSTRPA
ncbi:MAG TPA: extracellular solute-binding protein [Alphaproteobacteria bacterium]|nr:extracellular solute-binding protein [Alphaproteobacteria bacterium]